MSVGQGSAKEGGMVVRFEFIIYGQPVAWQRAGSKRIQPKDEGKKAFTVHFTREETRQAEVNYRAQARMELEKQFGCVPHPIAGQIILTVKAYRSIPKSFSKKKAQLAEAGIIRPITKPDLDNYIKAVKDAFKSLVWIDDCQVIGYGPGTGKYYSSQPRIEIIVEELIPDEITKQNQ